MGWEEVLSDCDMFVNVVGGYTDQRTKAVNRFCDFIKREEEKDVRGERFIRHLMINPKDAGVLNRVSPVAVDAKMKRVNECEGIMRGVGRCVNCARVEGLEGLGEEVGKMVEMGEEEFREYVVKL